MVIIILDTFLTLQHAYVSVVCCITTCQPAASNSIHCPSCNVDRDWSVVFRCIFVKTWESVYAVCAPDKPEGIQECATFNFLFIYNYFNGVFNALTKHIFYYVWHISVYIQPIYMWMRQYIQWPWKL